MAKVLLATVYGPDPVLLAANKLGPDRMILFVDLYLSEVQKKSIDLIKNSLGRVIDVKIVKTKVYDIVDIARKVVEVIDLQPNGDEIHINITSGRKTKAIGLLFGAYARYERVKRITYYPEEKGSLPIFLPKLQFNLTESQKKILEYLDKNTCESLTELSERIEQSTAMLYRNIKELRDMGLVEELRLTDAGKIARL